MSGIFDKYLNMINTGSYRHGGGGGALSGKGKVNANKTLTQLNAHDVYIPYEKSGRRSSSVGSMDSRTEAELKQMAMGKDGANMTSKPVTKRLSEPNNRVNF